jgi:hypothetical protein
MEPNPNPTRPPAASAPHPSASPCTTYLADEVGHLSLAFLLIDATRYNLSRPNEAARGFVSALTRTLPRVMPHIRQQLVQDIEAAVQKDALTRGALFGPLGSRAELAEWQHLVQLAKQLNLAGS